MSDPSDCRFDLNFGGEAAMSPQDNICRPSFLSPTGLLIIGDSVMKNDMTAVVVTKNFRTPKDNRLLSKRSDELVVKDSLALSVQCTDSVRIKHGNKQLQRLAYDYATNMKRKLDQLQESDGQILLDHQSIEAPNDHPPMPSLSGALPTVETSPEQPL
ncbi:unnamed protein product [Malus baccata var. baccata]